MHAKSRFAKKYIPVAVIAALLLATMLLAATLLVRAAEETPVEYIYMDLAAGNVTVKGSTYEGAAYQKNDDGTFTLVTISGTLQANQAYYVYQSKGGATAPDGYFTVDAEENKTFTLPTRTPVTVGEQTWGDYVTNNSDVEAVITAWNTQAANASRTSTPNTITVTGQVNVALVIDNLWSSYEIYGTSRTTGGISFYPSSGNSHLTIQTKGDNRFGNIFYNNSFYTTSTFLTFDEYEEGSSLTVANLSNNSNKNYWCAAIGGNDSGQDAARGLIFNGGTVFAGTNARDDCTAIGGGGNGYGGITINGGRVTATVASSGAAIGGGIGKTSNGGQADIVIGGDAEVYAYNASCTSRKQPGTNVNTWYSNQGVKYIPAAAIGGGSSAQQKCNACSVTIQGNAVVYAQTVGGAAIGGGSSADSHGGDATVKILGNAKVTALSLSGVIEGETVQAGNAIGGGTGGKKGNGGYVSLEIAGTATLKAGSVGGGGTITNDPATYRIGYANIKISGGDISAQFIMAAGASQKCTLNMSGGIIDNSEREASFVFLQENGGAIYMDDPAGTATISGGVIESCTAKNGGAIYMTAGTVNISDTAKIHSCSADQNGGAIYMGGGTLTMTDGELLENRAVNGGSIYLADGTIEISGGSLDGNRATEKGGVAYLGGGTLTIGGNASVTNNQSQNGGAAYLQKGEMHISGGTLSDNTATENGGAAYLAGGELTVSGDVTITQNSAQNGGVAYLTDGTVQIAGGTLKANKATVNGGAAYLGGGEMHISGGTLSDNTATENGGAAYLAGGTLTIGEPVVTLADEPVQTGGALITQNSAQNGGAAYLQSGEMHISGGMLSNNNATENGGAAYLGGGTLTVEGTAILTENKALQGDGGAAYVNGGDVTISGTCMISANTAAINGGGICVNNGNVTMSAGTFDDNTATEGAGGALYVSADTGNVQVIISGGTISNNDAKTSGGALSVVGDKEKDATIFVTVGCNVKHEMDANGVVIPVPGDDHDHELCPQIQANKAETQGGAIYVTGAPQKATLTVYCLVENGNEVAESGDDKSDFLMIDGGSVVLATNSGEQTGYGNIQIENTVHVTGGQVDLRGSMDDILILENMTIDILDAENDHFIDSRNKGKMYYKLEYFENFQGTGRYTAYQLKTGEANVILPAMYSHEGYTLDGWEAKGHGVTYKVDQSYTGEKGNLQLYAVWRLNGYLVTFNSNVPLGETSWGSTSDVTGQFNKEVTLPNCSYVRPGYNFVWWERTLEDGTKVYYKYDEKVVNLSIVDGTEIEMKAIWEPCAHKERDGDQYPDTETQPVPGVAYSYQGSGNCITLNCSCHGYTETATVRAQSTVYDKNEHSATVQFSHAEWQGCTLTYQYRKHSEEQFGEFTGTPQDAGVYIATITYLGKTASITYVIEKAEQSVPVKPTYSVERNTTAEETTLTVTNPNEFEPCAVSGQMPVIRLVYFGSEDPNPTEWTKAYDTPFVFAIAYTNYYVEICYPETDNYKQSVIVVSDATYYIGNVEIIIDAELGINCTPIEDEGNSSETLKGLTVNVSAVDGYYLTNAFSFSATSDALDAQLDIITVAEKAQYSISNIPDNSTLTIKVTGASRGVIITSNISAGEKFESVTGTQATIGQDGVYTAYFTLNYYDPTVYSNLCLDFGSSMPKGTSVIMMDLSMNAYWYYVANADIQSVLLTEMTKMGDTVKYDSQNDQRAYVFVVSYANAETLPTAESLSPKLTANTNDASASFTCPALSLTLTKVSYQLQQSGQHTGLDQYLSFTAKESGATAIVLTPENDAELPIDAYFKLVEGQYETNYYQKGGKFIIPLRTDKGPITLTLCSGLFPQAAAEYVFDVQYLLLQTKAASAPLNGKDYTAQGVSDITFSKAQTPSPSICLMGEKRVYSPQEMLDFTVQGQNLAGCSVQVVWMYKNAQGTYSLTGWDRILEFQDDNTATEQIKLASYVEHENFCLKLIVSDSAGKALFEVPYYFILQ